MDDRHQRLARTGLTALFVAAAAAQVGCGGGGGGGGSPSPAPAPAPAPPAAYGQRVATTTLDYDANGTPDATEVYTYDSLGRVSERRYTYTGDGTADRQALFGDQDSTDVLSYDGNTERVASQTTTYADGTGSRYRVTYDGSGRPTRTDSESLAAGGAVTAEGYTLFQYSGDQLTGTSFHLPNGTLGMQQTLAYDPGTGLPVQSHRALTIGAMRTAYEWNGDGSLAAERQDVDDDGTFDQVTLYTYAGGRLQSTVRTMAGLYAGQQGLTYRFVYDGNGRLQRSEVDLGSNGSVDAIHHASFEAGDCRALLVPVVFPLVTENGYASAASFEWHAYCSN